MIKQIFRFLSATMVVFSVTFFLSCNKEVETFGDDSLSKSELIYKNSDVKIEKVSKTNDVVKSLFQSEEWTFIKKCEYSINYDNINLFTLNYSEIKMLFFPIYNSSKSLIVYVYYDKYLPIISEEIKSNENKSTVILSDINGKTFNKFSVKDNKVISYTIENILPSYDVFGGKVGFISEYSSDFDGNTISKKEPVPCNESTTTFNDCMECAIAHVCDDWLGIAAFAMLPKSVLAACVIHCM